jgi:hypothetical protein
MSEKRDIVLVTPIDTRKEECRKRVTKVGTF